MLRDRAQLVAVCRALTDWIPGGPYWTEAEGMTPLAADVIDGKKPRSSGERTMLLVTRAVWNGGGDFGPLMRLDDDNLRRIGGCLLALAGGAARVDDWLDEQEAIVTWR